MQNIIELAKYMEEQRQAEQETQKETQAQLLIKLAENAELFHNDNGDAYATIPVENHWETHPVRSKRFRLWLGRRFYELAGKPPGSQALSDALGVIEAKALFEGEEKQVFIRVAEKDGAIYVDLANDEWQAVEITPAGWRVIDQPPVKFIRKKGMAALPYPVPGGSLATLRPFINAADEKNWILIVAWLVAALRPTGPYPILTLQGEQGSAKSTTARILRSLVDPSTVPLRTTPRDERDLVIAASNGWVLCFDNMSGASLWLSDALCRISTGGGFGTRTLYENDEETLFSFKRPIILNGIDDIATRQDLLDRSLVLYLPSIPENKRREERAIWDEFEKQRPMILGALFDVVSGAMRELPNVNLDRLPRMADFAKWVTAAEKALGWIPGTFMSIYDSNRSEAVELGLESDPVAGAIRSLMDQQQKWEGTPSQLVSVLGRYVPDNVRNRKTWVTSRSIRNRIRRLAPGLRSIGIEYRDFRTAKGRMIVLEKSLTSDDNKATMTINDDEEKLSSLYKPSNHATYDDDDVNDDNNPILSDGYYYEEEDIF